MGLKKSGMNQSEQGYSIKKHLLKKWIYEHDLTQTYVAKCLRMSVEHFKQKLLNKEKFCKSQLKALVYLMGASAAFQVIYFPTTGERRQVYYEVFILPKRS